MNTKPFKAILFGSLCLILVLMAALSTTPSSAGTVSPFVGTWHATDLDGSQLTMVIGGKQNGPFKITITDSYITFCGGGEGIYRGTGELNSQDPSYLEAEINVLCVKTGKTLNYQVTTVYNPANDTLLDNIGIIWSRANLRVKECVPPPYGISGWWPGDGNANDIISGRNGTPWGDTTTGTGLVDQAFLLDGDGDYIEIPYNPNDSGLDFGTGDFTIDLWVNFNDINGEQILIEKWFQGEQIAKGWTLTKIDNTLYFVMDDGTGGETLLGSRPLDLKLNTWYQFAVTRQGQTVTLYMNGSVIDRNDFRILNLDSHVSLKFGRRGNTDSNYLNGRIDEVEIYNGTALSQDQIFGIYAAGEYGKCKAYFNPSPFLRAHPEWDSVDIWNWPEDKILQLTVDDPNTNKNPDVKLKKSSNDKYEGSVWFALTDYDLKSGDIVTITDGVFTKVLTVSNLAITTIDFNSGIVAGSADPLDGIRLPVPGELFVLANEYGDWIADFASAGYNLQPGMTMIAEESDDDGDLTSYEVLISNARIVASEAGDWFWTTGFNQGSLDLYIYESAQEGTELLWSGQAEADESGFSIIGIEQHGLDLVPGNYLVVSDGVNTKGIVLQSIWITYFDTRNEIMAGYAPPGSLVWAAAGPLDWQQKIMMSSDRISGGWEADFKTVNFDITEDMRGSSYAHVYDMDGDANEGSTPSPLQKPYFTIFPEWEWYDGLSWPDGALVSISVTGKGDPCTTTRESWGGFFNGGFPEGCDVKVGDTVRMTDGTTTQEHTVRNLAITVVDEAQDTVSGMADLNSRVYVWPHATGQELVATAYDGAWQVDFSEIFDLAPNECGRAQIYDSEGNGTAIDWCVPFTLINVFPVGNYVEIHDWRQGVTATASIVGKEGCTGTTVPIYPDWEPQYRNPMQIYFPEGCDIDRDDVVMVDNGITYREHIVQNLSVITVDGSADTVSGTADPTALVHVWPHGYGEIDLHPTVGSDGSWTADFSGLIDLQEGLCGRSAIWDEAGNSTSVDWCVPPPP